MHAPFLRRGGLHLSSRKGNHLHRGLSHPAALFSTKYPILWIRNCRVFFWTTRRNTLIIHSLQNMAPTSLLPGIHFSIARTQNGCLQKPNQLPMFMTIRLQRLPSSYLVLACDICVMPTPRVTAWENTMENILKTVQTHPKQQTK